MLDPISGAGASFCAVIHRVRFCAFSCRLFFIFPSSARPPLSLRFFFVESVRKEISSLCDQPSDQRSTIHNKVQPYAALIVPQKINKSGRWWLASSSLRWDRIGLDWIGLAWTVPGMGMVPVESPRRRNVKNANAHLISLFSSRYKIWFCFLMFHNLLLARA